MARTRAQEKAAGDRGDEVASKPNRSQPVPKSKPNKKRGEPVVEPQDEPAGGEADEEGQGPTAEPPAKKTKVAAQDGDAEESTQPQPAAIAKLLHDHGDFPLSHTALKEPMKPTAETMLAHLLNALLTSTRISHKLAAKTVEVVVKAGWANPDTMRRTSWEEKTKILTEGGYTHYREKTATQLDDLGEWLESEYEDDLSNLLKEAQEESPDNVTSAVRKRLEKIKGLGNVALDVFCDTAQGLWTELAPFIDPRSAKAAEQLGLPPAADELFKLVGNDPVKMCRLAAALTEVRLEGEVDEVARQVGEQ